LKLLIRQSTIGIRLKYLFVSSGSAESCFDACGAFKTRALREGEILRALLADGPFALWTIHGCRPCTAYV